MDTQGCTINKSLAGPCSGWLLWMWYSPSPPGGRLDTCAHLDPHPPSTHLVLILADCPWRHLRPRWSFGPCWIVVLFSVSVDTVIFFPVLPGSLAYRCFSVSSVTEPPWTPGCLPWKPLGLARAWVRHGVDIWTECVYFMSGLRGARVCVFPQPWTYTRNPWTPLNIHINYLLNVT